MEIKINLDKKDFSHIMRLASAGCTEILDIPELCLLKNNGTFEPQLDFFNNQRVWWYKGSTAVHALAFNGYSRILDYPQYLKVRNELEDTPLHYLAEYYLQQSYKKDPELVSDSKKIFDRILRIKDLDKLEGKNQETPLHYIAKAGYTKVLDYPNVELIETPKWNAHGTPMTLLYSHAKKDLDKLLKHSHILIDYKTHGTPLEALSRNNKLRPTVKNLKQYGFKFKNNWYPTKKLNIAIARDIQSVNNSIQFMIY